MAGRPRKDAGTAVAEKPAKAKKAQPKISGGATELKDSNIGVPMQSSVADDYINSLNQDNSGTQLDGLPIGNVPTELKTGEINPEAEQQLQDAFEDGNNGSINPLAADAAITVDVQIISSDIEQKDIENNIDSELSRQIILKKYDEKCNQPSDINQLLPYLRSVSECCDHITEFGVRNPTSTWAFLAGNPKQLVSYDIYRSPGVDEVEAAAPNFKFILGDTLEVEIEETDFLFIDTVHTATQLERELTRHASKVRRYLGFHDVHTFGQVGEYYQGIDPKINCGRGLWFAITPFLQAHPEWKIDFQTTENNGLLILRRIK